MRSGSRETGGHFLPLSLAINALLHDPLWSIADPKFLRPITALQTSLMLQSYKHPNKYIYCLFY